MRMEKPSDVALGYHRTFRGQLQLVRLGAHPTHAGWFGLSEGRTGNGLAGAAGPERPAIVYLHDNAGNIACRTPKVRPFLDRGYVISQYNIMRQRVLS